MTDTLYGLVSVYGLWVVGASAYLSCLAVPIPTAVVMLTAGAFAAAGDLSLWQVWAVAWLAAVAGDQTGFHIGRWGGPPLIGLVARRSGRHQLIARAEATVRRNGGLGVFFSTWLFAPLGPWVNLIAGAARLERWRFTLWDVAGETIWVTAYVVLGYLFGTRLDDITRIVSDWGGLVLAASATVALFVVAVTRLRHTARPREGAESADPAPGPAPGPRG